MGRYVFHDYPPQPIINEGVEVVKNGTIDGVVEYAKKIENLKLPYNLTRPTSWRHLIVGIYSRGIMDPEYSPKKVWKRLVDAPIKAYLIITLLYAPRKLPVDWIEGALDLARGGEYQFDIYQICNEKVPEKTTRDWLRSSDLYLRRAGLAVCAVRANLNSKTYALCESMRVDEPEDEWDAWTNEKVKAAMRNWVKSPKCNPDLSDYGG